VDAEDRKLVQEAQGGVRAAFGSLVDRYRGRVYALAISIMGDHESALRLTKETFIRAHRELKRLEKPERFPAWIARLAYQVGRELRHDRLEDSESELANDRSEGATIATPFDKGEAERALLEALLSALPERVRVALDLRFREGLTYAEIAETLDLKPTDVRALLERGTRKLRTKLRPYLKRRGGAA
jgi:RNA polymerase sigma-70 factor (ECF subfamily)